MKATISSTANVESINISIYLFGSFISNTDGNDIDLLLIYNIPDLYESNKFVCTIKSKIHNAIFPIFQLPIHFTTLHVDEIKDLKTIDITNYIKLL